MEVRRFQESDAVAWDAFVARSRNGTFFQTRRFLEYHPKNRFIDQSIYFTDGSSIMATLSAAEQELEGNRFLVSHPGASYGGLVLAADAGMTETGRIIDALTDYARGAGFMGIHFLRLTPPSVRRAFSDDQEYWLFQRGWRPFRIELATSLSLAGLTEASTLQHFDGKCRNMIRQAQRAGITVRETDDFATFWDILESMLAARHASRPTHALEEIQRLKKLCPNDIRLFAAYDDGTMVAGSVGIVLHDQAIYTLYMAQDYAHQATHPLHLIVAEIANTCIRESRSVLHFGISTEKGGSVVNEGLFFFKESFNGKSVRRESWKIVF